MLIHNPSPRTSDLPGLRQAHRTPSHGHVRGQHLHARAIRSLHPLAGHQSWSAQCASASQHGRRGAGSYAESDVDGREVTLGPESVQENEGEGDGGGDCRSKILDRSQQHYCRRNSGASCSNFNPSLAAYLFIRRVYMQVSSSCEVSCRDLFAGLRETCLSFLTPLSVQ